ncbi:histidine kinase [Verrucomicrobia bacterium LW23]|nr:histidine kinase [Verrucomicrobia bacterium LW23]
MQIRLRRFVEDRVRMLAAVGHDLRTPITSLRLRAEFIPDQDTRDKFLATLAEMQTMTEAALNFARSEASGEPTRVVDLTALLESLCDDLADMGWDVRFLGAGPANAVNAAALTHAREAAPGETDGEPVRDAEAEIVPVRLPCACRPDAIRRAVRNVIENAVRYGDRARVFLHTGPALSTPCTAGATRNGTSATMASSPDGVEIVVEDDGPGVPEADRANIFAPFVRLETSRNRSTGGVGLGLSIARSILRGHGGDIYLTQPPAPRPQGAGPGLRVHLRLPSCDPEQAARRA